MRLARPREQQGSGVSDYVVSHGCDCLETHGWVQLPAIAEAVCVCVAHHERHLGDGARAPVLPPVSTAGVRCGRGPASPPLAWQSTSTSVNDLKPHLSLIQGGEKNNV